MNEKQQTIPEQLARKCTDDLTEPSLHEPLKTDLVNIKTARLLQLIPLTAYHELAVAVKLYHVFNPHKQDCVCLICGAYENLRTKLKEQGITDL